MNISNKQFFGENKWGNPCFAGTLVVGGSEKRKKSNRFYEFE